MPYPAVTSLYKYRQISENSLESLLNEKLWVAQPSSFNDPFDCSIDSYAEDISDVTLDAISRSGFPRISEFDLTDVSTRQVTYSRHCPIIDLNNLWDERMFPLEFIKYL